MGNVQFTITEAVQLLHPPITDRNLRAIIAQLPGFTPAGSRHDGTPGRPHHTYEWADLTRLHAAITPWLTDGDSESVSCLQCVRDRIPENRYSDATAQVNHTTRLRSHPPPRTRQAPGTLATRRPLRTLRQTPMGTASNDRPRPHTRPPRLHRPRTPGMQPPRRRPARQPATRPAQANTTRPGEHATPPGEHAIPRMVNTPPPPSGEQRTRRPATRGETTATYAW